MRRAVNGARGVVVHLLKAKLADVRQLVWYLNLKGRRNAFVWRLQKTACCAIAEQRPCAALALGSSSIRCLH